MTPINARLRHLVLAIVCAMTVASPALAAGDATPDKFLASIYHQYEGKHAKGVDIDRKGVLARYFEPTLVALIAADEAAAAKHGDVPELDGDPFIDAQDWEITDIKIATVMDGADKATATVNFRNFNEPHSVTVKLVKLRVGWRISDIIWAEASLRGLYDDNH